MKHRIGYLMVGIATAFGILFGGALLVSAETTAPEIISIRLDKTVGTSPDGCATTSSISVGAGSTVYYCYKVTNIGVADLETHTVIDDKLGSVITDWVQLLTPNSSTYLTKSAVITATTVNSATWYATHPLAIPGKADDTAVVNIPAPEIAFTQTVGTSSSGCATTSTITVSVGTTVYYCYALGNEGLASVSDLTVTDDQLGAIVANDMTTIAPAMTTFITKSAVISAETTSSASFSAVENFSLVSVGPVMDGAQVNVEVVPESFEQYFPFIP